MAAVYYLRIDCYIVFKHIHSSFLCLVPQRTRMNRRVVPFISLPIALALILETFRMGEAFAQRRLLRHSPVFQRYGGPNHHHSLMTVKQMYYSRRRRSEEKPERPRSIMRQQFADFNREREKRAQDNKQVR